MDCTIQDSTEKVEKVKILIYSIVQPILYTKHAPQVFGMTF